MPSNLCFLIVLEFLPDVFNDLDLEDTTAASNRYLSDPRNIRKIREHTASTKINFIHPVRPGKKLVVLDLDYSASGSCGCLVHTI